MVTTTLNKEADSYTRLVIDAIEAKIGDRTLTCPVSQDAAWEVQEYWGMLPASNQPGDMLPSLSATRSSFPLAVLVCGTCGYSMMFNLLSLGLGEQLKLPQG